MNVPFSTALSGLITGAILTITIALFMYWPSNLSYHYPQELHRVSPPADLMVSVLDPSMSVSDKEAECLAKNIFFEAGVEPWEGKIAVGQVTLNRMGAKRWQSTICGVVYAKNQFSWTRSAQLLKQQPRGPLWEASVKAAQDVLAGVRLPNLRAALFYHTDYIDPPDWASPKFMLAQVSQHVFYFNDLKR